MKSLVIVAVCWVLVDCVGEGGNTIAKTLRTWRKVNYWGAEFMVILVRTRYKVV